MHSMIFLQLRSSYTSVDVLSFECLVILLRITSYNVCYTKLLRGVSLYNSSSDSASNIMLVSPVLSNLGAGTHRLKFAGRNSTATQDIEIGTLTDPTDPTTFTVFETVDLTTSFAEYTVDFSVITSYSIHYTKLYDNSEKYLL